MFAKKVIFLLIYLIIVIEGVSQCGNPGESVQLDGGFIERGHTIVAANQGGFLLGSISNGGFGQGDWIITKLSSSYTIEWSKNIGSAASNETGDNLLIQPINTGGYIIAGYQVVGSSRELIFSRIDDNGNVIWSRLLNENDAPGETAADILQLSDNNFLIVGTTNTYGSGSSDGFAFKFDINGNVLWAKSYGNGPNEHFYSCSEISTGEILCTGEAVNGGVARGWVAQLDLNGNMFYTKTLNTVGYSLFMDCKVNSSNSIFCTGLENYLGVNKMMLMNFELDETINFSKVIIGDNLVTIGSTLNLGTNGDIFISGVSNGSFANQGTPFLLKTNSNGVLQWSQFLNFTNSPQTLIRSQNSILINDSPIVVGWNGPTTNTDIVITSLNQCGENECTEELIYSEVDRNYSWINFPVVTTDFNSFQSIALNSDDYELNATDICLPLCNVEIGINVPTQICTDTQTSFEVFEINGLNVGDIQWEIGTSTYSNIAAIDSTFTAAGTIDYEVTVFDSTNTCSSSLNGNIPVIITPDISLPNQISLCEFPTDTLAFLGTYVWTLSSNPINPNSISTEGIYTAVLENECGISTDNVEIELYVITNPVVISSEYLCPDGDPVTVSFPANAYVEIGNNQISSPYEITDSGNYTIEYISPEGCSDIISTTIIDHSTIDENSIPFDTLYLCSLPSNELVPYYDDFTFYQNNINSPFTGAIQEYGTYYVSPTTPCGVYQSEITVLDGNIDFSNFEETYLLCENQTIEIDLLDYPYTVDNQATSNPLIIDTSGTYQINTTNNECSNGISIEVISYDETILLPSELCLADALDFNFQNIDSLGVWSFENSNPANDSWLPEIGENYIYHEGVCGDQVQVITVNPDFYCDCLAYIPNAFTPNSDAHNEIWEPIFSNSPFWFEYRIFNRWGEEIFINSNNEETDWIGDHVSSGEYYCQNEVYSWILQYQCVNNAEITEKRGFVVVIR
ncbi:MAG: hypothetical protein RL204_85 [Bacteroidota bacterium]|jgi:hypothetical protein